MDEVPHHPGVLWKWRARDGGRRIPIFCHEPVIFWIWGTMEEEVLVMGYSRFWLRKSWQTGSVYFLRYLHCTPAKTRFDQRLKILRWLEGWEGEMPTESAMSVWARSASCRTASSAKWLGVSKLRMVKMLDLYKSLLANQRGKLPSEKGCRCSDPRWSNWTRKAIAPVCLPMAKGSKQVPWNSTHLDILYRSWDIRNLCRTHSLVCLRRECSSPIQGRSFCWTRSVWYLIKCRFFNYVCGCVQTSEHCGAIQTSSFFDFSSLHFVWTIMTSLL